MWCSFILFIMAVGWILVLPYEEYNKRTYISENALLPGQVKLKKKRTLLEKTQLNI